MVTDMKEFLTQKRVERAARGSLSENKVKAADSHIQPGFKQMVRARRPRLLWISGQNELGKEKPSTAKGN